MRILIADDHGIVRQGLRVLIENQADMEVVGEAENGLEVVELAGRLSLDVILMDISMPNLNGVEATRLILRDNPNVKIIALSVHFNKHFVTDMLQAGASGYVLKSCLFDEVISALHVVNSGKHYLSSKVSEFVLDDYLQRLKIAGESETGKLTERERHVIQLLAEGKTTKQIGLQLHVSPKTVDSNRREAMDKLGISNVAELTKYAIREGLTSMDF